MLFDFIRQIRLKIFNKKIINYKYVHLVYNEKFILPFIEFMNKNFNENHCFIYIKPNSSFKIPLEYKNVIVVNSSRCLEFDLEKVEKIFVHSMSRRALQLLYRKKDLLRLSYWIIWGYDVYGADNHISKYVKNNVKAVITNFDKTTYQKKYNDKTMIYELPFYPSIIKKGDLDKFDKQNKDSIIIQINNSADLSTIDMLNILAKYKDENIKICTILSYGQIEYNDEIIEIGQKLFKDKFFAVMEYLTPEKYAQHIKNIDILVLNQQRQQGVGNIRCNLYLGHKVFIRGEITTFQGFKNSGFKIFDSNKIKDINFEEFISFNEENKQNNCKLLKCYFDDSEILSTWKYLYKI